ncbi:MAG TPA: AI-2E family transporter [Anaeromyxobacteraceae bacterium]|nr:AI-2E family transporter [Anaeromyxobacteraceae bacterium]
MQETRSWRRAELAVGALVIIAVILSAFALKQTRVVTAPLGFAFFAALLLQPIRIAVSRRMPRRLRWLGVAAATVVLVLVFGLLVATAALGVTQAARELPKHLGRLASAVEPLRSWAEQHGLVGAGGGGGAEGTKVLESAAATVAKGLSGATEFAVLAVFFAVLMLIEAGQWRKKVARVLPKRGADRVLDATAASTASVRRYLLAITSVGLATAVLEGGFLAVVGIPLALFWALLFFVLNYVPYVGSIIAAVPPILFAFATQGLTKGFLVALGILVIEQVMGNLVAPLVEGRGVRLSPLVVLAAVSFWGWAWGAIGAVLAVPLTVSLALLCARVPWLEPVAKVLAEDPDEGV